MKLRKKLMGYGDATIVRFNKDDLELLDIEKITKGDWVDITIKKVKEKNKR